MSPLEPLVVGKWQQQCLLVLIDTCKMGEAQHTNSTATLPQLQSGTCATSSEQPDNRNSANLHHSAFWCPALLKAYSGQSSDPVSVQYGVTLAILLSAGQAATPAPCMCACAAVLAAQVLMHSGGELTGWLT